jgi:hypothetical protein
MEPEGSSLCSQELATCPYHEPNISMNTKKNALKPVWDSVFTTVKNVDCDLMGCDAM